LSTFKDGLDVHSFKTLIEELGTQARVRYRVATGDIPASFEQLAAPTPIQKRAFELLQL